MGNRNRTEYIGFWVTKDEKEQIRTLSKERYKTMSHYIRDRTLRGEITNSEAVDMLMSFIAKQFSKTHKTLDTNIWKSVELSKLRKPQLDLELMVSTDKMSPKQREMFVESKIVAIDTAEDLLAELKERFIEMQVNP